MQSAAARREWGWLVSLSTQHHMKGSTGASQASIGVMVVCQRKSIAYSQCSSHASSSAFSEQLMATLSAKINHTSLLTAHWQ